MKRMLSILASFVVIVLLSCSFLENSFTEDVSLLQTNALAKTAQNDSEYKETTLSSASAMHLSSSSASYTASQSISMFTTVSSTTLNSNELVLQHREYQQMQ